MRKFEKSPTRLLPRCEILKVSVSSYKPLSSVIVSVSISFNEIVTIETTFVTFTLIVARRRVPHTGHQCRGHASSRNDPPYWRLTNMATIGGGIPTQEIQNDSSTILFEDKTLIPFSRHHLIACLLGDEVTIWLDARIISESCHAPKPIRCEHMASHMLGLAPKWFNTNIITKIKPEIGWKRKSGSDQKGSMVYIFYYRFLILIPYHFIL